MSEADERTTLHGLIERMRIWAGDSPPAPSNKLLRDDCAQAAELLEEFHEALKIARRHMSGASLSLINRLLAKVEESR